MKDNKLILLVILQLLYVSLLIYNKLGEVNIGVNKFVGILLMIISVTSLIISIIYFFEGDIEMCGCLSFISILEIGFTMLILNLPYMINIA